MNQEIKLHDIKQLVEIPDFSFYLYLLLLSVVILIIVLLIYLVYKLFKNRKKDERKTYYEILENIDFKQAKKSAYEITKYGKLLATSDREKKLIEELIEELEKYKYKKEVTSIDNEVKILFNRFMDSVDV
ncbi:hypothetical protein [Halarcobacter bivalviorum]|uniref:hypothetical protein n=1 Tax=Halarcobacter bivalviorum TaxID=663364 RepID=UPI00100B0198|nr:hypothetical protein [Halarcobacter bivalviorum]RXK02940.1 hypothetical protein CRU97_13230 [Halarcobacter bivalviorum]